MTKRITFNRIKKAVCAIVSIVLLVSVLLPLCVNAQNQRSIDVKTVKIGWYHSDLFQEGMSDKDYKSGYSYEYIHKIADYSGWKYEYVYGEWPELFAMLENGEIDIMAGVSKTEERLEKFLYPNEIMGNEHYVLFQNSNNRVMDSSDISTFEGRKIGAISNNLMTTYLEKWLEDYGAKAEIVYYDSFDERDKDFDNGKIDGIVTTDNGILQSSGYSQVVRVGSGAYYLAVAKNRDDLLIDLNRAQTYLQDLEPYFLTNLEYQCYGTTLMSSTLSTLEEEWLDNHNEIVVGYLENYMPYCGTDDDGNVDGLITDVMNAIISELNIEDRLSVTYKGYADGNEMIEALKNGEIGAAFPVGGEVWQLEQHGINATNDLVTSNVNLIYNGNIQIENIKKIAITKGNVMMYDFISEELPGAEFVEYSSIDKCLDAVLNGEADATTLNGLRIDIVKKNRNYNSLSIMKFNKTSGRCIGVENGNIALQMLLNRGIKLIGTDFASNASYYYMSDLYKTTINDIISDNLVAFITIICIIVALILYIAIRIQLNTKKYLEREEEKNKELLEKQEKLEEASVEQEAQLEEISALNVELQELKNIADEANRSKTDFLNNMSHDIRTPMNAILGFTELMGRNINNPEVISDYIKKIKSSGDYLLTIINNVLDMAKIESGKATLEESLMDLFDEEKKILSSVEETINKKSQTFTVKNTIKNRYVLVDCSKLQEITMNLLSNAIKYTPEGGAIQMSLDEFPSDIPGYGKYILTISDNGIGMTKEFQETIFEAFTRERNTTDSKIFGTGLGMAIVKKLVDLLDGTIELESEPGKGSTFKVTFNHKIAEKPEEYLKNGLEKNISSNDIKGKRILLTEDNDLNAEIATAILEDAGVLVERAVDGIECIDMLMKVKSGYYDMILMDVQMPNLNGYDTARRIRELSDSDVANIPIIAMTANAFEEDKQNALSSGMNDHISKPIDIELLFRKMSEEFNKQEKDSQEDR